MVVVVCLFGDLRWIFVLFGRFADFDDCFRVIWVFYCRDALFVCATRGCSFCCWVFSGLLCLICVILLCASVVWLLLDGSGVAVICFCFYLV